MSNFTILENDLVFNDLCQFTGHCVTFTLISDLFSGKFRIDYFDKKPDNLGETPVETDFLIRTLYYQGTSIESIQIEHCTEAFLFVERNKYELLHQLLKDYVIFTPR